MDAVSAAQPVVCPGRCKDASCKIPILNQANHWTLMRIVQALVTAIHSTSPLSSSTLAIAGASERTLPKPEPNPYPSRLRCVRVALSARFQSTSIIRSRTAADRVRSESVHAAAHMGSFVAAHL